MSRFAITKLTPAQSNQWDTIRTALLWHAPYFSHIMYTMLNKKAREGDNAVFTEDLPALAATDGKNIILRPSLYFTLPVPEAVFVLAHEICHCVFAHCETSYTFRKQQAVTLGDGSKIPYDHDLMNRAQDYVINDLLIEAGIGKPVTGKLEGLHDKRIGAHTDSAVDVYAKLYKKNPPPPPNGSGGAGPGAGKPGFDEHLEPGAVDQENPGQAAKDRQGDQEWEAAIASALQTAKLMGNLPASMERVFGQILEPQVSWREKLEALFARKLGAGSYNWRKPDRIFISRNKPIFVPARSSHNAGVIVVAVDTSGSVNQIMFDMFITEVAGLLDEVKPQLVHLLQCDAAIGGHNEIEDPQDLLSVKITGGGGTNFVPVFDWIAEQQFVPDALVYLTDGYGRFPDEEPAYPVVWGNISDPKHVTYPFGDVVDITLS